MTISYAGTNGGTITVNDVEDGTGRLRFWTDAKKDFHANTIDVLDNVGSETVYVEGVHESLFEGDVAVHLTYTDGNGVTVFWTHWVTVTPVVLDFAVTPAAGQNINFVDRTPTGLQGLAAYVPANPNIPGDKDKPGVVFTADVLAGGLSMTYVQDVMSEQNGVNGSAAGMVFPQPNQFNLPNFDHLPRTDVPLLAYPILDAGTQNPYYPDTLELPTNDPNCIRLYNVDSPTSGAPAIPAVAATLESIDLKINFKICIVVKYDDGSLYGVANATWRVNFFAGDNKGYGKGVSTIFDPEGVTANPSVKKNDNPAKTSQPAANDNVTWQPVP
jgi:hypothetical protein